MSECKHTYWEGKKRDKYILSRLSESKFKKILQYDSKGMFIKQWESSKEIGIKFFNDYKIVNGGSKSCIYKIIHKSIYRRFFHGFYWFKESELLERYNCIPLNINIEKLIEEYKKIKTEERKTYKRPTSYFKNTYTIIEYDHNHIKIRDFDNIHEASKILNKSVSRIKSVCRNGNNISNKHFLSYGNKTLQLINLIK